MYKGDAHTDIPLSNYAMGYRNDSYIADLVCPRVPVKKESDKYYIYGTEDLKHRDTLVAQKTASKGIKRSRSTDTYFCNEHALHEKIDDKDRENSDDGVDPDLDAVDGIMENIAISLEVEIATLMTTNTNYSSATYYETLTGGDQWNDPGYVSDPIGKIAAAKMVVFEGCLKPANAMVMPYAVANALEKHPAIVEYLKYVGKANLTPGMAQLADKMSAVFGLECFIAASAYDSTREGQTGHTFTQIWSDYVVVFHLNRATNWKDFAFCKNFNRGNKYVSRIPQPLLRNNCEIIEVNDPGRDPKMIGNTGGYLFIDTMA